MGKRKVLSHDLTHHFPPGPPALHTHSHNFMGKISHSAFLPWGIEAVAAGWICTATVSGTVKPAAYWTAADPACISHLRGNFLNGRSSGWSLPLAAPVGLQGLDMHDPGPVGSGRVASQHMQTMVASLPRLCFSLYALEHSTVLEWRVGSLD